MSLKVKKSKVVHLYIAPFPCECSKGLYSDQFIVYNCCFRLTVLASVAYSYSQGILSPYQAVTLHRKELVQGSTRYSASLFSTYLMTHEMAAKPKLVDYFEIPFDLHFKNISSVL